MAEGEVVYEIRGDDSNLDRDLDAAQKKVEQSTEKSAEKTEKIEKKVSETVTEEKEKVTNYHKHQNNERVEDDKDTGKEREEVERSTDDKIKAIAGDTAKAIGAGLLAAGAAAVTVGGIAVKGATDMDQAVNQFMASTGLAEEYTVQLADGTVQVVNQAENYRKVMEEIYKDNFGENFDDIAVAMSEVNRQMAYLDDAELKNVTESAFTLRDVFGYEVAESVRAANSMVDQFGISADEAFNLIAQGAQYGLDYSGELLDSINEYAPQFKKLGLNAEDMFQVLLSGVNAGAFNLDKIGDAVKELSIRVVDGSDTTRAGFEALGLDADKMAEKFGEGGESAKQAFQEIINGLASMNDPLAQNTAGVNLFGTMWEDLGGDVVTSLAEVNDGIDQTYDSMQELQEVKYDDLGSMLEALKRSVEMFLIPLGEELIPVLTELIEAVLPMLQEALPPLMDSIGGVISAMAPVVDELLPLLMDAFSALMPPLMDIVNTILPILVELFQELLPPITEIITSALPVLVELLDAVLPLFQAILDILAPLIEYFIELLDPILDLIEEALLPLLEEVLVPLVNFFLEMLVPMLEEQLEIWEKVFNGIFQIVSKQTQKVTKILKDIITFIKGVFTGDWKSAWEAIKNIFKGITDSIAVLFKDAINAIIDFLNKFINGINKIKIPDWVPGIGGKGFNIPTIPRLRVGMDWVPEDDFPALLHRGEAVLTAEENARLREVGGVWGLHSAMTTPPLMEAGTSRVTVDNVPSGQEIDYARMGSAVADALIDGNVRIVVGERDFGRLERDLE